MKKIVYLAAAAALMGFASCGSGAKSNELLDSIYPQKKVDSLFVSTGKLEGLNAGAEFNFQAQRDSSLSKSEYLKGFMYAINGDTTTSFTLGMQKGMQFAMALSHYSKIGLTVDKQSFVNSFRQAFMQEEGADSLTRALNMEVQMRWAEFQKAMEEYENAMIEASEESQSNLKHGKAYIEEVAKKDAAVKVDDNGLAVKIDTLGTGASIADATRVYLTLSGKTIEGKEVDSFTDRAVSVNSLVPGLRVALREFTVGTVATVYVPGPLAYGTNGKRFNIGPNETIVYNVKVNSIYDPAAEQAKAKKK